MPNKISGKLNILIFIVDGISLILTLIISKIPMVNRLVKI